MDSVFTKITNAPQITKWTTVTDYDDFTGLQQAPFFVFVISRRKQN